MLKEDSTRRTVNYPDLVNRIQKAKCDLRHVETRTVTADGRELVEEQSASGRFVCRQVGIRPWGFVGDFKPDLQIAEVSTHLFMGSQDVAQDLDLLTIKKITHIVNVATGIENFFKDRFVYFRLEILDLPSSDLLKHLLECLKFIRVAISNGGKVFVHCNAGISRSASIVIAYLMRYMGKNLNDAMEHVKSVRPAIRPNDGFIRQLEHYEYELSLEKVANCD